MFHHMTILRSDGSENTSEWEEQDIAGPLCFQGDYITKGQSLPRIEGGDLVVLHDTGGYTHALYSRLKFNIFNILNINFNIFNIFNIPNPHNLTS